MKPSMLDRYDVATLAGLALLGAGAWLAGGAGGVLIVLGLLALAAGLLGAAQRAQKRL